MNFKFAPYPCRKVEEALKNLGFTEEKKGSTSHVHWSKIVDGRKFKATVDCHRGEVKAKDVVSIIAQAGVTKKQFLAAMDGKKS